ncbi:unnamed protein product, partial [Ectocarpus sp. 13 AM-2016]
HPSPRRKHKTTPRIRVIIVAQDRTKKIQKKISLVPAPPLCLSQELFLLVKSSLRYSSFLCIRSSVRGELCNTQMRVSRGQQAGGQHHHRKEADTLGREGGLETASTPLCPTLSSVSSPPQRRGRPAHPACNYVERQWTHVAEPDM